jgi:hypothetical protein
MARGGKRVGAGRPPKPLAEKVLEGNPGKRPLYVIDFPDGAAVSDLPSPPEFLAEAAKGEGKWPSADTIFRSVSVWLERTGCLPLISPEHIMDYALLKARWLECEAFNTKHGLLARHPVTKQPIASPYVRMGIDYLKAADVAWTHIWEVISQNSLKDYSGGTPHDDVMEKLLTARKGE